MDDRPLILTALLEEPAQQWFDDLRRRHFPPERNHLDAHLTLFHHLPGSEPDAVARDVGRAAERPPMTARVTGPRLLGRGVGFRFACRELAELRADLARTWSERLTRQDAGKSDLHVTVQNKVTPAQAGALHASLADGFEPYDVTVVGLALWRYDGGPWEPGPRFPFRS